LQEKDVEQCLWKTVVYAVIEEFRRRIKSAAAAGEKGEVPLRKVQADPHESSKSFIDLPEY
jgi:hypothetical protein